MDLSGEIATPKFMALQGSGQISFQNIEDEFGQNGSRSLGAYRLTQNVGTINNIPLDSGIPTSGTIKFSDFYNKRLNIVVDCFSGGREDRKSAKNDKWNNNAITVVGGFRSKRESGSKIIINVGKKFCSDKNGVNNVALRTGSWDGSATVQIDVGSGGQILGAGGDGGNGNNAYGSGSPGGDGSSGLGVDVNNCTVNIQSGGIIRAGFGGGGGGGGGRQRDKGRDRRTGGGGGGGGMGCPPGNGGSGSQGGGGGGNGTETSGGGGGGGGNNDNQAYGGAGGSGGQAQGGAGSGGRGFSQGGSGGSGGASGAAIRRISGFNVTINNNGTIQGDTNATGIS